MSVFFGVYLCQWPAYALHYFSDVREITSSLMVAAEKKNVASLLQSTAAKLAQAASEQKAERMHTNTMFKWTIDNITASFSILIVICNLLNTKKK